MRLTNTTVRRAALAAMSVFLLAGVAVGVMSYGPSNTQRAYAMACEAIREKMDNPESVVFPAIGDEGVEVRAIDNGGYYIHSHAGSQKWSAIVFIDSLRKGGVRSTEVFRVSLDR